MVWRVVLALLVQGSNAVAWPQELNVTRHFHTTDRGQLHYVIGGDISSGVPLVMLHSDPRSSAEFKYLVSAFSPPRPFVAVDFYGMGFSEECRGCNDSEFVKFTDYAAAVHDILMKNGINKFVPVGCLKGTNPALALADLAGAGKVEHIVQISPLMLPPAAVDYMNKKFIPSILHPSINLDGSHLLKVWNDPSAAPLGPDGKPDNTTRDLLANEEKTIDFLRCRDNGARPKHQMAWVDYNSHIPAAAARVSRYAHFLMIHGTRIDANYVKYGMHPEWGNAQLAAALAGGLTFSNITIDEADEGILIQNSTLVAGHIKDFLEGHRIDLV